HVGCGFPASEMHRRGFCRPWLWIWLLAWAAHRTNASLLYWSAYVTIADGNRTLGPCECGLYGLHSPLNSAQGLVALPRNDPLACNDTAFDAPEEPWIALVKRGDCLYTDKIEAAKSQNASAVVIYNIDGTGNETNEMMHPGTVSPFQTGDIVVIMIGNAFGKDISHMVMNGSKVYMKIERGNPRGLLSNPVWIWIMCFIFITVTALTLGYFTIVSVRRIHQIWRFRCEQTHLKSVAQKAIQKLKVRTLKRGDEEVGSEAHSCAVCIEGYKEGEVVTVLTCSHFFHKSCIEPWLLEHRTCPMCKSDILGAKVSHSPKVFEEMSPVLRFLHNNVELSLLFFCLMTDAEPTPHLTQTKERSHDNPAFEEDMTNTVKK
uniref:RING-type domain-containing protein n=1 Tax=Denticeps clupeoides TaxID=299321 RepID=A0AAY4ERI6_9TELE